MRTVRQAVWRWKIAAYLFFAGMGAGAVIVGTAADLLGHSLAAKIALTLGVPVVSLSTLFLIADLGRPSKFLMAVLHPGTSWISRGFLIISGLILSGGATVLLWVWPFGGFLEANPSLRAALESIAFAFAVATCIYTGILIGIVVSRPFWNSPILPVLFLISAVSTGIAGVLLTVPMVSGALGIVSADTAQFVSQLESVDILLIIFEVIALYLHLTIVFDRAPEAARLLLSGNLAGLFWGGFLFVGLLVPAIMEFFASSMPESASRSLITIAAGVLLLIGGYLLRQLILAAGIRAPLFVRVPFTVRPGL